MGAHSGDARRNRDWSERGSERGAGFALARLVPVGGMSTAGDGERGNVGQEDSAAAGPFRFSPEPTLEDM